MKEALFYNGKCIVLFSKEGKNPVVAISLNGLDEINGFESSESQPFGTRTREYLKRAGRKYDMTESEICEALYRLSRLPKPRVMEL